MKCCIGNIKRQGAVRLKNTKPEAQSTKQIQMTKIQRAIKKGFEHLSFEFSIIVSDFDIRI
jgi:hypothetical protein